MANEQLKVYYPHAGKHFLLKWHSYDEQNKIVLTKNQTSLFHTAKAIFNKALREKRQEVKIIEAMEIETVSLPDSVVEQVIEQVIDTNSRCFRGQLSAFFGQAKKAGMELPEFCKPCNNYVSEYKDGIDKEYHFDCKNCDDGFVYSMPTIDMYHKFYEQFEKEQSKSWTLPKKNYGIPSKQISVAPKATSEDTIFAALTRFGDHGRGVSIEEVDQKEPYQSLYDCALFFFTKISDIDVSELISMLQNAKNEQIERHNKIIKERAKLDKQKEKQYLQNLMNVFKNISK